MKPNINILVKVILVLSFIGILWCTLTSCSSIKPSRKEGCQQRTWFSNYNYHNKPLKN